MKNTISASAIFALSLFTCASLNAFGGNEGPQASPVPPRLPIASITIGGGMPRPGGPQVYVVTILDDGSVVVSDQSGKKTTTTKIAQLSNDLVKSLKKADSTINPGPIQDEDPTAPSCEDAPTTTYSAFHLERITIAQVVGCKKATKADPTDDEITVKSALDAVLALSNLPRK